MLSPLERYAAVGDEAKLAELMLYVAQKCFDEPDFGAIVLNKILFFSDFISYASSGQAITGVEYQRLQHGPAPRRLLPVRSALVDQGAAVIAPVDRLGQTQHRLVALRRPDLAKFAAEEIALVDEVIDALRGQTATSVSDLSHLWSVAWQVAAMGETIPYSTVFAAAPGPLTPEMLEEGEELAARYAARE